MASDVADVIGWFVVLEGVAAVEVVMSSDVADVIGWFVVVDVVSDGVTSPPRLIISFIFSSISADISANAVKMAPTILFASKIQKKVKSNYLNLYHQCFITITLYNLTIYKFC